MKNLISKFKLSFSAARLVVFTFLTTVFGLFPFFYATAAGLVPCGPGTGGKACTFCDLFQLIQNVIKYAFGLSLLLGTIFIIVGGFKILTAGESPQKVQDGKSTIIAAIVGIAIALGAWLIIDTVLKVLNGGSIGPWNTITC